jgi:hypothetical protein
MHSNIHGSEASLSHAAFLGSGSSHAWQDAESKRDPMGQTPRRKCPAGGSLRNQYSIDIGAG